jgi:hypothetical protein
MLPTSDPHIYVVVLNICLCLPPEVPNTPKKTLDPFELRELGKAISDHARPASPVTPDHPSRPQTPTTTEEDNSGMTTPQGPAGAPFPPSR